MLERFIGENKQRFVVEALETQPVVGGRVDLAAALGNACDIDSWEPGEIIRAEGDGDNHLLFLLAGTVSVLVRGRQVAVRKSGQHDGEMALLDPGSPRSATLVADDEVVAARISATAFREIASTQSMTLKIHSCLPTVRNLPTPAKGGVAPGRWRPRAYLRRQRHAPRPAVHHETPSAGRCPRPH